MSAEVYTTGAAASLALALALGLAAVRIRAGLLPPLRPSTARLCELIIALGILVLVSEALGSVGLFERWPLVVGCSIVAGAAMVTIPRSGAPRTLLAPRPTRLSAVAVAAGAGLVAFAFGVGTFAALHGVDWDIDSVGYHLPEALRFFQSHRLTGIQFTSLDPAPAYYPANAELLHAVGMALLHRDALSVWVNLAFAGVGLLAGWCLGETLGYPPAMLLAFAAVAVAPSIAHGGTALNDVVGMALLTATAALGLSPRGARVRVVGALAAGLALGTKLNLLVPVAGLALAAVALAEPRRRLRSAGSWIVAILAGGGFWFARNLADTGSPLPLLNLGPLPHVKLLPGESTNLVQALSAGTLTGHEITSALAAGLGRAWPVMLLAAVAGLVVGAWRGTRVERAVGLVGLLSLVSFVFTPLTGSEFLWTVRYLAPTLVLGLALAASVPAGRYASWGERWAPLSLLALTLATIDVPSGRHTGALLTALVVAAAVAAGLRAVVWAPLTGKRVAWAASALALAAVVGAGYPVARRYIRERFTAPPGPGPTATALVKLAEWSRAVRGARIAVTGTELQYELSGPSLTNYVQYVGRARGRLIWSDIASCRDWREAIDAGRYDYVVTTPTFWPTTAASLAGPAPAGTWTAGSPTAREILHPYPTVSVFRLRGALPATGCA